MRRLAQISTTSNAPSTSSDAQRFAAVRIAWGVVRADYRRHGGRILNGAFVSRLRSHGLLWEHERRASELLVAAILARLPLAWRWQGRMTRPVAAAARRLTRWVDRRTT